MHKFTVINLQVITSVGKLILYIKCRVFAQILYNFLQTKLNLHVRKHCVNMYFSVRKYSELTKQQRMRLYFLFIIDSTYFFAANTHAEHYSEATSLKS